MNRIFTFRENDDVNPERGGGDIGDTMELAMKYGRGVAEVPGVGGPKQILAKFGSTWPNINWPKNDGEMGQQNECLKGRLARFWQRWPNLARIGHILKLVQT